MLALHVVGARPNFMKVAPVYKAFGGLHGLRQLLVHTGQHYDAAMSDVFFRDLGIPTPDINLQVGSATHAKQTADIMRRFEPVVLEHSPNLVLVYGDVNSTVAAALVCSKMGIPVAHVEAGLRSFDRSMPEEINRLVTDQLSELLFTPSDDADRNLAREGIAPEKIHLVGNVMIDTLVRLLPLAQECIPKDLPNEFALATLHRPANVDDSGWLTEIMQIFVEISREVEIIFPVHPRTRARLQELRLADTAAGRLHLLEPMPYVEFLGLLSKSKVAITDSGGVQEESTFLGIPCLTMRDNTERPITIDMGTNQLIGREPSRLLPALRRVLHGPARQRCVPKLWDGHAAERIAHVIADRFAFQPGQ